MGQFPSCLQAFLSLPVKMVNRVSWQPESGVRIAAVVVVYGGAQPGFVLAGRSLREIEKRESQIEQITGIVWLVTLAVSLVVVTGCELLFTEKKDTI
jgi:hypothetical protein